MTPFYGQGSIALKLHNHNKETVYFSPLTAQKFLVLIYQP